MRRTRVSTFLLGVLLLCAPPPSVWPAQKSATKNRRARGAVAAFEYCRRVDSLDEGDEQRSFALNKETQRWEEVRLKAGDEVFNVATVSFVSGGPARVEAYFSGPSGDWTHFVNYCFRPDGTLAEIEATLNTFLGHLTVKRQNLYDSRGKLLRANKQIFKLGTRVPTTLPDKTTGEFIDRPPPVYRKVAELPFRRLLLKSKPSARKS